MRRGSRGLPKTSSKSGFSRGTWVDCYAPSGEMAVDQKGHLRVQHGEDQGSVSNPSGLHRVPIEKSGSGTHVEMSGDRERQLSIRTPEGVPRHSLAAAGGAPGSARDCGSVADAKKDGARRKRRLLLLLWAMPNLDRTRPIEPGRKGKRPRVVPSPAGGPPPHPVCGVGCCSPLVSNGCATQSDATKEQPVLLRPHQLCGRPSLCEVPAGTAAGKGHRPCLSWWMSWPMP